jgi:hypothetical protein
VPLNAAWQGEDQRRRRGGGLSRHLGKTRDEHCLHFGMCGIIAMLEADAGMCAFSQRSAQEIDRRRITNREVCMAWRLSMAVLTCALLCSTHADAQTAAAMGPVGLRGTVSSAQEGAMEGVLVSAKKTGSTITTTVATDEKGHYAFPASRLQPGHYVIAVRAVGYSLKETRAAEVAADHAASADIVLEKVTDLHQLADQLTNGEWLNSMPGNGFGCADCHTLQRIVNSTHTADEWMEVIPRMATYSNGSTPAQPQPLVPGPRQANEASCEEPPNISPASTSAKAPIGAIRSSRCRARRAAPPTSSSPPTICRVPRRCRTMPSPGRMAMPGIRISDTNSSASSTRRPDR